MGLFDKLFAKKEESKRPTDVKTTKSCVSSNAELERLLSVRDGYTPDGTIKILTMLQSAELFQFCDTPEEGKMASCKQLTFTMQVNDQTMKLLAIFTNHDAMRKVVTGQEFFCMSSVDIFNRIATTVIEDSSLDGIVVNPQQQNYIITKQALLNWVGNNNALHKNVQLLKTIEEKIASYDGDDHANYIEIIDLLSNALLPIPIKKDANGKDVLCISMHQQDDGKIWLCIFTDEDALFNYMNEKTEVRYLPHVLKKFAVDTVESDYLGIIVNRTGRQFLIPKSVCNAIALGNGIN